MAQFTNQATLVYNGVSTVSNITAGELVEALSVQKQAVNGTYTPQGTITYAVSLVNTGATPLIGLTLTDDLGAYPMGEETLVPLTYVEGTIQYYVNGELQAAPAVTAGAALTVMGLSLPADGSGMVIYQAAANAFAPLGAGSEIVNEVTVTGETLSAPVTASDRVTPAGGAALSITKAMNPTVITVNEQVTYTFTLENTGPDASDPNGAVVTDSFDPILSDVTVTFDGAKWTRSAQYEYDETTGLFQTLPGAIQVPAASYAQDTATGAWVTSPGTATLTVTGTI